MFPYNGAQSFLSVGKGWRKGGRQTFKKARTIARVSVEEKGRRRCLDPRVPEKQAARSEACHMKWKLPR